MWIWEELNLCLGLASVLISSVDKIFTNIYIGLWLHYDSCTAKLIYTHIEFLLTVECDE